MKRVGTISYNIYCNFTNYGSVLQTWALHQSIKKYTGNVPVLIDYCPDVLLDLDPLNPIKNMWDIDDESRHMCELSLPAIRENYKKLNAFYSRRFERTPIKYTSQNFDGVIKDENLDGFICGSDTIFCIDEFKGFDDGYYANYPVMKKNSVAYAASFGDAHFSIADLHTLDNRINNFKAIGIREKNIEFKYIKRRTQIPVEQVIDPTLLLDSSSYDKISAPRLENEKYLLLYSRRYNPAMEKYAEDIAEEHGWKIVEISLRATNAGKPNRKMFYEAGVEEFLSLVKYAEFIVTNSYHGMIFSVLYKRPFIVFSREQCDTKIGYLASLIGVSDRIAVTGDEPLKTDIDYEAVLNHINTYRQKSIQFLCMECELL